MDKSRTYFGVLIELADKLGVADDRKREVEDKDFSLKNLVIFPFTEMWKSEEKTGLSRKLKVPFRPC